MVTYGRQRMYGRRGQASQFRINKNLASHGQNSGTGGRLQCFRKPESENATFIPPGGVVFDPCFKWSASRSRDAGASGSGSSISFSSAPEKSFPNDPFIQYKNKSCHGYRFENVRNRYKINRALVLPKSKTLGVTHGGSASASVSHFSSSACGLRKNHRRTNSTRTSSAFHVKSVYSALRQRRRSVDYHKIANKKVCIFYARYGKCTRNLCPNAHDPKTIALCSRFLRGTCEVDNCPFSHRIDPDKTPTCAFFQRPSGCKRSNCPYVHARLPENAPVCLNYLRGYCQLGRSCMKRHVTSMSWKKTDRGNKRGIRRKSR